MDWNENCSERVDEIPATLRKESSRLTETIRAVTGGSWFDLQSILRKEGQGIPGRRDGIRPSVEAERQGLGEWGALSFA